MPFWPIPLLLLYDRWPVHTTDENWQQGDGRSLHVRKATVAEPDLLAIYRALGIGAAPGGIRKLIS